MLDELDKKFKKKMQKCALWVFGVLFSRQKIPCGQTEGIFLCELSANSFKILQFFGG